MGCGCRKQSSSKTINKTLTLEELRAKVSGVSKPTNTQITKTQPNRQPRIIAGTPQETIFTTLQTKMDPYTIIPNRKMVLLITANNNVESKYIKTTITKLSSIRKEYKDTFSFVEIDKSYLLNTQDITSFPCTILINKTKIFKKYFSLFDVQKALDEFLALKDE